MRSLRSLPLIAVVCASVYLTGCTENFGDPLASGELPDPGRETPDDGGGTGGGVSDLLSDQLQYGVFSWPSRPFSESNMAPLSVYLQARDRAVEFTLADVEGVEHTLSDLLETKPVLLVIGSYTCPVYQEALPKLNAMSAAAFGETTLGESVHFVHVYVPEAHPLGPDPAPHLGAVSEEEYSTLGQPRNYADRLVNARRLIPSIDPSHLMLVDDLAPRAYDNPIWSTYGSGAASAWLIGQDGVIAAAHVWLDTKTLEKSMRYLLSRGG